MPYQIENRMVVESQWNEPPEVEKKLNSAGYEEIGTGIFVSEEDAYAYALERISLDEDLQNEFVEWFYSGNWIKEY
ncbi:MAG: hypothetical protein NC094_12035 [Bacteroidales bacterium]|nr:hypothetical protein [Lachnoclostridium sp.]MCM1385275.1 hypothetical protein [Lachnoclostridium sp.]MCM1466139.1 hypothetical protein [Bacteroidales bacterium]